MTIHLFGAKRNSQLISSEVAKFQSSGLDLVVHSSTMDGLPDEVKGNEVKNNFSVSEKWIHLFRHGFELLWLMWKDAFLQPLNFFYWKQAPTRFSWLLKCSLQAESLRQSPLWKHKDLYISYFLNDFALVLSLAKSRGYITSFNSRAHGRDIIHEREPKTKRLAFQRFMLGCVDKVFTVSEYSEQYLRNLYPDWNHKFQTNYLGTPARELAPIPTGDQPITIVSIGYIRNVKRFYLIPDLLLHLNSRVKWIHFGGKLKNDPTEHLFDAAIKRCEGEELVQIDLMGSQSNEEIMDYLSKVPIDFLINTSEYEGLPLSIQEVISFGIPCVATDVGGVSEIVNEQTGILIEKDFKIEEVATAIQKSLHPRFRDDQYRRQVQQYWAKNFDSDRNFARFLNAIQTERMN